MTTPPEPEGPPGRVTVVASYAVVVVLAALLALWGAFLVPFRVADVLVPVSWGVAVVGNAFVCGLGARLVGPPGAAVAALVWAGVVVVLGMKRAEGDLIVSGTAVGLGFLLLSMLVGVASYGLLARASSEAPTSR